jgi:hypothetical protein
MTIYEIMQHRLRTGEEENGVATHLHETGDGAIALKYHATDVVTAYPDGSIKLDSGGYSQPHYAWSTKTKTQSPTTRERISRYLPEGFSLYQEKKLWWVAFPNGDVLEFIDGMVIRPIAFTAEYPEDDQAIQGHFKVNVLSRRRAK